jgi:hypothetical protein
MRQRRNIHPTSSSGSGNDASSDEPEAAKVISKFLPKQTSVLAVILFALVGMYIGGWANAPVTVSPDTDAKYNMDLIQADNVVGLHEARSDVMQEKQNVYKASGWFSCDAACQAAKARLNTAVQRLKPLEEKRYEIIKAAKHEVGVWSKYGVDETREKFWETFQDGKDFAKRMTFWDMMFSIGRRDESGGAYIAKMVMRVLMNYTMGMAYTLISFMFQLFGIVRSYTPNFASGVVFYLIAIFSAISIIGAFLFLLYATCIGGFYMLAKNARPMPRHGGGNNAFRPRHRVQYASQPNNYGRQQYSNRPRQDFGDVD